MGSPPHPGVGSLSAKAVIRPEGLWGVSTHSLGAPRLPRCGQYDPIGGGGSQVTWSRVEICPPGDGLFPYPLAPGWVTGSPLHFRAGPEGCKAVAA